MSTLEAIKKKKCTRCLGCCYLAIEVGLEIKVEKGDNIPLEWLHVPIFDGKFEFVAVCNFASFENGQTSCIIQDEKPKFCTEYFCWEDEEFLESIGK